MIIVSRMRPALPPRRGLHCPGDQYFPVVTAALPASDRIVLRPVCNTALVDLDHSLKQIAVRIDHGFPQLVQQQPSGLVGADAELRLKLQRGDAI